MVTANADMAEPHLAGTRIEPLRADRNDRGCVQTGAPAAGLACMVPDNNRVALRDFLCAPPSREIQYFARVDRHTQSRVNSDNVEGFGPNAVIAHADSDPK